MNREITRWRPSPALVVAIVALIAATAGTAVAGGSKKVRKIADKQIAKKASGLSVAHAGSADSAGKVNGVELRSFNFHSAYTDTSVQIFSGGGLTLTAGCAFVGTTSVTATTSVAGSYLGTDAFDVSQPNTNKDDRNQPTFNPGDNVLLLTSSGGVAVVGHTGYYNQNSNVQVQWTAHRDASGCNFVGYAAIG